MMSSGGLGTLAAEPKAIFEQKSKNLQSEFALISLVTLREELVGQMKALVQNMAVGTRKIDCGCVTEFFGLIHKMRESTYDLVEGVQAWQNAFTHNIRPQMMSVDYLVTMIHSTDFVSGSSLRRTFTFSLSAFGNIFMLAQPIISTSRPPNKCDDMLMDYIHHFANPDELRMINCYKILKNCLPPNEFDRLMPISYWMNNKWKPHVVRTSTTEADKWYLTGGEDKEEVVMVHKNFLRKKPAANMPGLGMKREEGRGRKAIIMPGTSRGAAATDVGPSSSTATIGGDRKASVAQGGAATATATTEGSPTRNGATSSPQKSSPSGKGNKREDSDDEEDAEKPPVVDFVKIIQDTFQGARADAFGGFHDSTRVYSRKKEYEGPRNCTFAVDHLLDEVDRLERHVEKKKPNYLAASSAKNAKKNAFADAEEARIKEELAARRATKGLSSDRPPTPSKSVEEAADKLKERGISSEAFRLIWQETHF